MTVTQRDAIQRLHRHLVRIGHPPRILVADDDKTTRLLWGDYLKPFGTDIHSAQSGREAIAMIKANRYSVVLLDLWLGDMNGLQVINSVGHLSNFIIFTGHANSDEAREAATMNGALYKLQKETDATKSHDQLVMIYGTMVLLAHGRDKVNPPAWLHLLLGRMPSLVIVTKILAKIL